VVCFVCVFFEDRNEICDIQSIERMNARGKRMIKLLQIISRTQKKFMCPFSVYKKTIYALQVLQKKRKKESFLSSMHINHRK